jgi:hypothetical protein
LKWSGVKGERSNQSLAFRSLPSLGDGLVVAFGWEKGVVGGGAFVRLEGMDGTAALPKEETGTAVAGKAVGSEGAVLALLAVGKHVQGLGVARFV